MRERQRQHPSAMARNLRVSLALAALAAAFFTAMIVNHLPP